MRTYTAIYAGCAWSTMVSVHHPNLVPKHVLDDTGSIQMPAVDFGFFDGIQKLLKSHTGTTKR